MIGIEWPSVLLTLVVILLFAVTAVMVQRAKPRMRSVWVRYQRRKHARNTVYCS